MQFFGMRNSLKLVHIQQILIILEARIFYYLQTISGRHFVWLNLAGIVTFYLLFFNTIEPRGPSILVNHFNSFNR